MTEGEFGYCMNNMIVAINLCDGTRKEHNFFDYVFPLIFKISDTFYDNGKLLKYVKRVYIQGWKKISFTNLYIEFEIGFFNYVIEFDFWGDYLIGAKYDDSEILSLLEECSKNGV